jgi:hypothetical protein
MVRLRDSMIEKILIPRKIKKDFLGIKNSTECSPAGRMMALKLPSQGFIWVGIPPIVDFHRE